MRELKYFLLCVIGVVVFCTALYGFYWAAKKGSYTFFYEDMVIETIKETVTTECIKQSL